MQLSQIDIEYRVLFGISGMILLFTSFLIVFIVSQRKKLQYHRELHDLQEEQKQSLMEQNLLLEQHVEERTKELRFQKNELQKSLYELKLTQLQLIEKEKMASLGEMTAGIAHEIQNPLNFVNNFSEVNMELINELKQGLKDGNLEDVAGLADDLQQNLEMINNHGKRADSIVKGMLEHSKVVTGQKETTDLNKLANETLQISYKSFCLKDAGFSTSINTFFDDGISKIPLIPQSMQKVFLNLFNNAFYAVNEKKNNLGASYSPMVSVTTKKNGSNIQITVSDNGTGISPTIINKIFHPFFTTKPTGQGTGLGLSLSYDIIKAHGGEISVESAEEGLTAFIIHLPEIV